MPDSNDIKLDIIENFIDYFTSNETERADMKTCAAAYVKDDHVNELESLLTIEKDSTVYCKCNGFEHCGMCKSINLNDLITCKDNKVSCYHATDKETSITNSEKYHKGAMDMLNRRTV